MNWFRPIATFIRAYHFDPAQLDMDQLDGLLAALTELREAESGVVDHRRIAESIAQHQADLQ